jgi:hypothetical protein
MDFVAIDLHMVAVFGGLRFVLTADDQRPISFILGHGQASPLRAAVRVPIACSMLLSTWRPDFYAAAASLIPVLLLTISLQEKYFGTLYWLVTGRKLRTRVPRRPNGPKKRSALRQVIGVLACLSFLGGGVAEILSLRSLWYGHDYFGWFVFFMIAVLLAPNLIGLGLAVLGWLDSEGTDGVSPDEGEDG